ncbi:hypothetical protein WR164_13490 [Philodulcilactobacillus myokoensis]|uniref:Uncharacterized protein n=1 Tax=Philodulcilactobacillus myokoensis TaxID=2929573 RepID=A0A9W6B355_9LACO|nr:hypothetical protein WR164_13490 [Philodulcilactobacillus myokoensis]
MKVRLWVLFFIHKIKSKGDDDLEVQIKVQIRSLKQMQNIWEEFTYGKRQRLESQAIISQTVCNC